MNYDLIIFDIDGTITESWTEDLLPGVLQWCAEYRNSEHKPALAFATNQGGVGLRYWMEQGEFGEPEKYPTEGSVKQRLEAIERKMGIKINHKLASYAYQSKKGQWGPRPDPAPVTWSEWWRKPNAGMLQIAMQLNNALDPNRVLMVGDSDDDRQAAEAVGCHFQEANKFFNR